MLNYGLKAHKIQGSLFNKSGFYSSIEIGICRKEKSIHLETNWRVLPTRYWMCCLKGNINCLDCTITVNSFVYRVMGLQYYFQV